MKHLKATFKCFQDFRRSGCLQVLTENIRLARKREEDEDKASFFSFPSCYRTRLEETCETCAPLLLRMRESYSPVDKLDALLAAVRVILASVST